jgi:gas vesicle protein
MRLSHNEAGQTSIELTEVVMKFLFGFVLGFGGALLLAPDRGDVTRRRLMEKAQTVANTSKERMDNTVQNLSETARAKAGDIGSEVGRRAAEAVVASMTGQAEKRPA